MVDLESCAREETEKNVERRSGTRIWAVVREGYWISFRAMDGKLSGSERDKCEICRNVRESKIKEDTKRSIL